jgi:two-component system, OmpR family, phosphate regulon sensor histidine kinase PhoR
MLRSLFSLRTLIALVFVICGAYFAGLLSGNIERITVMTVTAMIAFFVVSEREISQDEPPRNFDLTVPQKLTEHAQFQLFINTIADPMLIVENARVSAANTAALDVLGANVIGQNVQIAFRHAGAIERLSDPDAQHDARPIRLIGIGQRDQIWEMRIQSIGDGQKLVNLTDRTSAIAAEKMRVDFVANASHELLTPLAAVKGFIETLNETEAGSDKKTRSRFLKIMAEEASRMQALIRDLMSLSRIEAEKYQLDDAPVDLQAVINEVTGHLTSGDNPRSKDISLNISGDLPTVKGDRGQLSQLVSNIISNAMKYGRAGTPIDVALSLSRSAAMLSFTVTDQGEGIAPQHLPRLTERFYRVDSGRSRSVGGTGLGLSLVKHIVDGHRGHLEIKSKLGTGTTIKVLLPIVTELK